MSQHTATIRWHREGAFARKQYQRAHRWVFDGGVEVPAAASPFVVPRPWTVEEAIDPEEAFVAAIASCHMLTFLFLAANDGFVAEAYVDDAAGLLGQDADGGQSMTEVTLRPRVTWAEGRAPTAEALAALHERAHRECFISRSVKSLIRVATP